MVTILPNALNAVEKGKSLERKQTEHHERMDAIKKRKPNSSVTLDNGVPKTLEGRAVANPRKEFDKRLKSHTTEQQNRYETVGNCSEYGDE